MQLRIGLLSLCYNAHSEMAYSVSSDLSPRVKLKQDELSLVIVIFHDQLVVVVV